MLIVRESLDRQFAMLKTLGCAGESQDTTTLAEELQEQQRILTQCIEQLEMCELARAALVSCLKEALREQVIF